MITLDLATLAIVTNGQLLCHESLKSVTIENLITDSRALKLQEKSKDAFLALKGPNFDGHRFAQQVVDKGCQVLIVDHQIDGLNTETVAQIIVDDTRIALGKIAAYVKQQVAPKTIGITGSSGKTTVKEMLAAILSRLGKVLATNGNFNNDIGVPLTLLRLTHDDDFAVIEMGANHIGEIAYTTELVKPDVAMINNIAAAHLEGFGDLCGVARAKGEIFSGLAADGIALYNQDTKYTSKWQWRLTDKQVRTFSCANSRYTDAPVNADIYSNNVCLDDNGCASFDLQASLGQCSIKLNVPGKHNVCNAVAAAAAAIECGASLQDIRLGLADMAPVKGRLNIHHLTSKNSVKEIKLIDDTYNANVESIKAAISLLANYSGQQVLILGDMAELGSEARSYHQEVGEFAKEQGINVLLTLGVLSQNTSDAFAHQNEAMSKHFSERADLSAYLFSLLTQNKKNQESNINILVKGSRSAHMENVVEEIISWHENRCQNSVCHASEDNS
ncbi:UDP-N-acetylmuramoyl-tripeptide--D-alanyl-D-alanine ligase [Candidatus Colwellia aromaticivorans]|uniref:UDP-N-acetylmuramoyl-tripeptide--D-alanyl-D- alanine ligase n=1 Tax=Candidatus Colwellia aromaticivorans TaxID=2267621 RepID=UPI000DF38C6C|nr:UDP-N-acetylmuramoyl-tripeptide--D-alanyl-D-alanine ligase [Candidatus Colwellia aromaticivorans]